MINSASIGNDIISYVYVGDFEIFGIPYPLEVLRADNIGLWWNFEDSSTLSQTIAPFTQVNGGDPVAYVYDKGMHGINGSQPITTKRMKYNITNGVVSSDMVDDGLEVSFPNSINSAYMIVDNYMGVYTYRINLSANNSLISGGYANKYLWNNVKNIFISTTLNSYEQSNIEEYYRNNNTPSIIENFSSTWQNCSNLTEFPLIDTSSGTNFGSTWSGCSSLTEFPLIDTSSGTNFTYTWYNCSSLTEFPSINTSLGTNFGSTWQSCSKLTEFPLIDTSSGTNFSYTWQYCSKLTEFPPNVFDNVKTGNFINAFSNTNLTQQSIDNILTSLVTSGISTGTRTFNQSGGSAPSVTIGRPAIDTLRSRGWTVTVAGGY